MAIIKLSPTKDGRIYAFKVRYKDLKGNTKQYLSKKYKTKREAQDAEMQFLMNYKQDGYLDSSLTFNELLHSYLDFQKPRVKISTYSNYEKHINDLSSLNKVRMTDMNIRHFNLWKKKIDSLDISTSYKNTKYKMLRSILLYGEKYHNLNINELLNKMEPFVNRNELPKEMLFFEEDEYELFIQQEEDIVYRTFFETLYFLGLRKGEAKALTWNDINFKNETVSITKSLITKIKGRNFIVTTPKNKSSIRTLPIPKNLLNDFKTLLNHYRGKDGFNKEWFIFGGDLPLADTTIENRKNKNCRDAGVKQIRVHDFRHSCASLLINKGASIVLVSKYLGHSRIDITLNTYTHLYKSELDDIIKLIERK